MSHFEPQPHFGQQVGTLYEDLANWPGQQHFQDCQLQCERFIAQLYWNRSIREDRWVDYAIAYGYALSDFDPSQRGGVYEHNVGAMLDQFGVPVHRVEDANIHHLLNELAADHKVIVSVDAYELWSDSATWKLFDNFLDRLGFEAANHAVVVSHLNTDDPNNILVTILDPGTGHAKIYQWSDFQNAWADGHFNLLATNYSAQEFWQLHPEIQHPDLATSIFHYFQHEHPPEYRVFTDYQPFIANYNSATMGYPTHNTDFSQIVSSAHRFD
ncbi:MAG: hypothetical protein R3A44_42975 [Caldilineaceae bacterium]